MGSKIVIRQQYGGIELRSILANEIDCRLELSAAVYAVTLNSCLRQSLSVTSIKEDIFWLRGKADEVQYSL